MIHELLETQTIAGGDFVKSKGIWRIEKRDAIARKSGNDIVAEKPHDILEFGNLLMNAGGALVMDLMMGAGGTAYNNANSYIGVGDSSTAAAATQTDLIASTNKLRKAMAATFPSRASQIVTFQSVFATGDANYLWNEIAAFNASSAGTMLNRALVSSPFTKTSSLSVTASLTWTIS